MGSDDINQRIKKKDLESMRELPCCKQGMKFHEVFKILITFCYEHKDKLEKWHKKNQKS